VEKQDNYILQVKSKTENLSVIRQFINKIGESESIEQHIIDNVTLAVDEACTNIIKHAYHLNSDKDIILSVKVDAGKLTVTLTDFGEGFNPDLIVDPDMPTYLKQRRVGGLGLHLMRKLMDRVEYKSFNNDRNQLILQKNYN